MGRDSAHTQLPLNMPQVQVGLWMSSFFEGHVDSLRDTLSLAQTACQGSALFDHMRLFFVDGVTYLDLVMKGKVKSEVHSPKPRQAAKRPLPLKDIQLQLNFDHPPAAADLDLTDWFVREDVKPLEEELERARQHPLFELFFVEAKARIAADGDDEDWCFGDFNGCPDGDLEDFLEFLRRQHGISEAPAELGQPPIEAAPKPADEAPPSADADPGQPPFEAAPKPADEAPPAAEADPGQPPFEAAPKPADEAPPAAEAEPGQPPFEAAPKLADEAPLGQPPEAAQQVAPCEAQMRHKAFHLVKRPRQSLHLMWRIRAALRVQPLWTTLFARGALMFSAGISRKQEPARLRWNGPGRWITHCSLSSGKPRKLKAVRLQPGRVPRRKKSNDSRISGVSWCGCTTSRASLKLKAQTQL